MARQIPTWHWMRKTNLGCSLYVAAATLCIGIQVVVLGSHIMKYIGSLWSKVSRTNCPQHRDGFRKKTRMNTAEYLLCRKTQDGASYHCCSQAWDRHGHWRGHGGIERRETSFQEYPPQAFCPPELDKRGVLVKSVTFYQYRIIEHGTAKISWRAYQILSFQVCRTGR